MRHIWLISSLLVAGSISFSAQTSTPPEPQTARQALIEMFMGKDDNDFVKHLPAAAHQALIRKGETLETSSVLRISTIGRQMVAQGQHVETFDLGPNILVSEQENGQQRIEVAVEHDSLLGESEEIELSAHVYNNGQPQSLPVVPRLIFTMTQEKEIWRLAEVTVAAHVPLTDPDYLQGLRKEQDERSESLARMRVSMIAAAETGYATKHPEIGYTCTLSTLFAREPATEGEGEGYFDPAQGNEESNGYRFTLTGCNGLPALRYRLIAMPADPDATANTYCTDESGTLKFFVTSGKSTACYSQGQIVNTPQAANVSEE